MNSSATGTESGKPRLINHHGKFAWNNVPLDQKSIEEIFWILKIHGPAHSIIVPDNADLSVSLPDGVRRRIKFSDFITQAFPDAKSKAKFQQMWDDATASKKPSKNKIITQRPVHSTKQPQTKTKSFMVGDGWSEINESGSPRISTKKIISTQQAGWSSSIVFDDAEEQSLLKQLHDSKYDFNVQYEHDNAGNLIGVRLISK
jgi:hypothetical protein